jgi:hypothetical protein
MPGPRKIAKLNCRISDTTISIFSTYPNFADSVGKIEGRKPDGFGSPEGSRRKPRRVASEAQKGRSPEGSRLQISNLNSVDLTLPLSSSHKNLPGFQNLAGLNDTSPYSTVVNI